MIQLKNPINLIGDLVGTVPVMTALAEKHGGLEVYQTMDEGKWIYDLLPKSANIKLIDELKNSGADYELDISEAFRFAGEHDLYMSQAYHQQVGLYTPMKPPRPQLEVPDVDVPIYDYILAPFSRSLGDNEKWSYSNWHYLYMALKARNYKVCFFGNSKYDQKFMETRNEYDRPMVEVLNMIKKCRRGVISVVTGISHLAFAMNTKNYLFCNQGGWGTNPDAIKMETYIPKITVEQVLEVLNAN